MFVDSHCHLDRLQLDQYSGDLTAALGAAREAGVEYVLNIATGLNTLEDVLQIARKHPKVFASVGIHPLDIAEHEDPTVEQVVAKVGNENKVVAIGETGLDYHYDPETSERQQQFFATQLQAAKQLNLPVIVHTREAQEDTLALIKRYGCSEARGVLHCFTESWEMAKAALDLGYYISISGIVTFRNASALRDVVSRLPLDRLLIETDAPYLTPAPFRGKPNEPRYVARVGEAIAELRSMPVEALAEVTTDNFFKLFTKAER